MRPTRATLPTPRTILLLVANGEKGGNGENINWKSGGLHCSFGLFLLSLYQLFEAVVLHAMHGK